MLMKKEEIISGGTSASLLFETIDQINAFKGNGFRACL